jgi:hypothetical protein
MLSIYFLIGSTEISHAMDAIKSDNRETKIKNTPGDKPRTLETNEVPNEVRNSKSAAQHEITTRANTAAKNTNKENQTQTIDLNRESQPVTTENTSSISAIMKSVSDVPTAVYESFKKALDFITRKILEDYTLTPKERTQLTTQCETAKQSLQDLEINPDPAKFQEVIDNFASIINEPIEGTTIHKDLMKAIDELDPDIKDAINAKIKELQTKDTNDLQQLKHYTKERRKLRAGGTSDQTAISILSNDKAIDITNMNPSNKTMRLFKNS